MKIDLAALVRRQGITRRKVVTFPKVEPTAVLTADLARIYLDLCAAWQAAAASRIMPAYREAMVELSAGFTDAMRMSDDFAEVRGSMDDSTADTNRIIASLILALRGWTVRMETWHRGKWERNVSSRAGVTLGSLLGPDDVRDMLDASLARQVALLKSVSDQTQARIADIIYRGFQQRTRSVDVARQISDAIGMSRKRALEIARDQTVTLSANLDTERMKQLGINRWKWRHSRKRRFRPVHKARDGKIFTWQTAPPPDDMPGIPPFCECTKEALLDLA